MTFKLSLQSARRFLVWALLLATIGACSYGIYVQRYTYIDVGGGNHGGGGGGGGANDGVVAHIAQQEQARQRDRRSADRIAAALASVDAKIAQHQSTLVVAERDVSQQNMLNSLVDGEYEECVARMVEVRGESDEIGAHVTECTAQLAELQSHLSMNKDKAAAAEAAARQACEENAAAAAGTSDGGGGGGGGDATVDDSGAAAGGTEVALRMDIEQQELSACLKIQSSLHAELMGCRREADANNKAAAQAKLRAKDIRLGNLNVELERKWQFFGRRSIFFTDGSGAHDIVGGVGGLGSGNSSRSSSGAPDAGRDDPSSVDNDSDEEGVGCPWAFAYTSHNILPNYYTTDRGGLDESIYRDGVIVFEHIQRTGGAAVLDVLAAATNARRWNTYSTRFGADGRKRVKNQRNMQQQHGESAMTGPKHLHTMAQDKRSKLKLITGAYSLGACDGVTRHCSYFTMFRDPVRRMISEFNYCRTACAGEGGECGEVCANDFVELVLERSWASLSLAEWAYVRGNAVSELLMLDIFSVLHADASVGNPVTYKRVATGPVRRGDVVYLIENLERLFAVVGITEHLEESMALVNGVYRLSNAPIAIDGDAGGAEGGAYVPNVSELRELEQLLEYDILLYKAAFALFERQAAAAGVEVKPAS